MELGSLSGICGPIAGDYGSCSHSGGEIAAGNQVACF